MKTHQHRHIPAEYQKFWKPHRTKRVLYHITTKENLKNIKRMKHLEPRDPDPKHWAGMKAIFMADPKDRLYKKSLKHVRAHVKEKHKNLVRLYIQTKNELYRSTDPARTFQVISLNPISVNDIIRIKILK